MFLELQISIRMISEGSCDTDEWSNEKFSMATTAITVSANLNEVIVKAKFMSHT